MISLKSGLCIGIAAAVTLAAFVDTADARRRHSRRSYERPPVDRVEFDDAADSRRSARRSDGRRERLATPPTPVEPSTPPTPRAVAKPRTGFGSFWAYSYDRLLDEGVRPQGSTDTATRAASARPDSGRTFNQICEEYAQQLSSWPVDRLQSLLKPTGQQTGLLEELGRTAKREAETMRAACPKNLLASPVERLDVVEAAASTMLQSIGSGRAQLQRFYTSLTEEQKARLLSVGIRAEYESGSPVSTGVICEPLPRPMAAQAGIERLASSIKPGEEETRALYELSAAFLKGAVMVQESCPAEMSLTPMGRLESLEVRLKALLDALAVLKPPLVRLYAALSADQKERLGYATPGGSPMTGQSVSVGTQAR